MRVAIASGGTEGDVQPLLAIGRGLRDRGHDVRFGAHPAYHDLIRSSRLAPFALGDEDPRQIVVDIAKANPRRSRLVSARRLLTAGIPSERALQAVPAGCKGADAVVYTPISGLAYHAAEALDVPAFEVQLVPLTPTREFPSPHSPVQGDASATFNRWSHYGVPQLMWAVNRRWVNAWRQRVLRLPALPLRGPPTTQFYRRNRYVLCAVSPAVIPKPRDWPEAAGVTGYLFAPSDGYTPPPDLVAFIEGGDAPVCVSFGSTAEADPHALRPILEATQQQTGRRFVYVKGWANYDLPRPSRDVFVVDRASYPWLYPRTLAVVHHAGTGTAAEAVRAGVPSVCVPHITEQRFWAARLASIGVAPPPIRRRDLTTKVLTEAIETACGAAMRARAAALGGTVRAEDGVSTAVNLIERAVGMLDVHSHGSQISSGS